MEQGQNMMGILKGFTGEQKRKIRLTKLKEAENPKHPNNIQEGFAIDGDLYRKPTVGENFWVGNSWRTSIVLEILTENTFRTMNSIYKIEIID